MNIFSLITDKIVVWFVDQKVIDFLFLIEKFTYFSIISIHKNKSLVKCIGAYHLLHKHFFFQKNFVYEIRKHTSNRYQIINT